MKHIFLPCVLLALLLVSTGCAESPNGLPVVSVKVGDKKFDLEVAATPQSQEMGLMKRDAMPEDHGMIFVFKDQLVRQFWMKDTRFPLDIIFLDSDGVVVSIKQMKKYDLSLTSSDAPARYAIELNKGFAQTAGVKVGDRVALPAEITVLAK